MKMNMNMEFIRLCDDKTMPIYSNVAELEKNLESFCFFR